MRGEPIRLATLAGSSTEMGAAHGSAFRDEIREYATDRTRLAGAAPGWGDEQILDLAERMLPAHEQYDPPLYEEMLAMAEAAGISPAQAVVVGGYTDLIDAVAAEAAAGFEDDCTAVLVPDALAGGAGILAQTWDMHASATPHVVMLDLHPDGAPAALVFSTVGTLGQIGMNEAGIAVGINNLTAGDGRPGVTWPMVVRKALRQATFEAAVSCVIEAELAGGHNFLVLDAGGNGASIEAMPTAHHLQPLGNELLAHTNHCLVPQTRAVEGERPGDLQASSEARLAHVPDLVRHRPVTVDDLIGLTRDERSICRHPEPPFDFESCGAAIMRPGTGEMWACWGIPSENDFEHFRVGS